MIPGESAVAAVVLQLVTIRGIGPLVIKAIRELDPVIFVILISSVFVVSRAGSVRIPTPLRMRYTFTMVRVG